ncbi:MAG TPA: EAL domain-containing protein, partial [Polyangiaceae bacterium]|nr:EAL domain-containing protein [Polyangiaceae bacterium]
MLLVDDEPQVLVALEDLLGDEFDVTAVNEPTRALRIAEEDPNIAVVLSDQRMPGMTGDELLSRLRRRSAASRILCTGYADLPVVVRSVNEGNIFAYVTKPWDTVDLRLKIQHAADHFRLNLELAHEKQLLTYLLSGMPDAIFFKDVEQRYVRVNPAFLDAFSRSDDQVIGKRLSELMAPNDPVAQAIEQRERELLADGAPRRDVLHYQSPDGRRSSSSTTRAAIRSADGKIVGLVGVAQDISEMVRTQEALRVSEERLRLAFLSSNSGLFDWNLETGETLYSPSPDAIEHGGESVLHEFSSLQERIHPDDLPGLRAALDLHLERRQPLRGLELRARAASGEYRWYEISAQAAWNEAGKAVRLVGATLDITDRKEQRIRLNRLDFLTRYDEVTELPNRAQFNDELERELAACAARGDPLTLLVVDLVRFRHVNETLGRRSGDAALREVARRLTAALRPSDLLARAHNDTFVVMMRNVEHESQAAQWLQQSLLPALSAPLSLGGTELTLSCKCGIAWYPSDASSADGLVAHAETALKQAKHSALPYLFYAPTMNSRVAEKVRLENKLRRALANDEFLLFYQPKIELKTGEIVGVEALIRWRDPEVGLVPPGSFIPVLEETQLILPVGHWVIERAAAQYTEWLGQGLSVPRIAVNVSALQLAQREFVASLDSILARYPAAAGGLDLELTESVLMDDLAGNIEKLREAKARGLQVAIDDFGTGYSSLGYLSRLPLDALKVDRSFIDHMSEDPQQMSIVTAIISLAHSLDLEVIAEGVETPTQAQLLRLLRCDQIQGYLMARPQPATDVAKLLGTKLEVPRA